MTDRKRDEKIGAAIEKALRFTFQEQKRPKRHPGERGGWRYPPPGTVDADLSVTSWHLMFMRSVKNAGFDVPKKNMDEA